MSKTESKADAMNRLFEEYGLLKKDDTFKHKHYTIITRSGIDKIQAKANIDIVYDLVHVQRTQAGLDVAVKAVGTMGESRIETFGEAAPENTSQNYPFAMAEKRAMSRAVLKLAGLYQHGVMSEDESDDFKRKSDPPKKAVVIYENVKKGTDDLYVAGCDPHGIHWTQGVDATKEVLSELLPLNRDQYEKTFTLLSKATEEEVELTAVWIEKFEPNDYVGNLKKVIENKRKSFTSKKESNNEQSK